MSSSSNNNNSSGSTGNNYFSAYNRPTLNSDSSNDQQQRLSSISSLSPIDPSSPSQGGHGQTRPTTTSFYSAVPVTSSGLAPTNLSSAPPSNVSAAAATQHPPQLNPRSCTTCRRRKVRCNKRNPCSNCTKAGIECIFPAPGRAPRKAKKPADTELLARLRRLEGVVQTLGVHVEDDAGKSVV